MAGYNQAAAVDALMAEDKTEKRFCGFCGKPFDVEIESGESNCPECRED